MVATFSVAAFGAAVAGAGFAMNAGFGGATGFGGAIFARDAGFATAGLAEGLVCFTVTFDVAMGLAFVGGRAAFLGEAAL
jgi:hypothetical protein